MSQVATSAFRGLVDCATFSPQSVAEHGSPVLKQGINRLHPIVIDEGESETSMTGRYSLMMKGHWVTGEMVSLTGVNIPVPPMCNLCGGKVKDSDTDDAVVSCESTV